MVLLRKNSPRPRDVDFDLIRKVIGASHPIVSAYFRSRLEGLENLPAGRSLLVSTHSGGVFPVDSFILGAEFHLQTHFTRPLHYLGHDVLWKMPTKWVDILERLGGVHGNPVSAAGVLEADRSLVVYPGGAWEVYRPFKDRNKVDWNGHMGYVRLAVKTRSPVVPMPSIGAHETLMVLTRGEWLLGPMGMRGKIKGLRGIPLALGFPFGLSLGPFPPHIPLPAQITIRALEPMELHNLPDGRALFRNNPRGDSDCLRRLHRMVQQNMQQGLDELAQGRIPVLG